MRRFLGLIVLIMSVAAGVSAQTAKKQYVEDKDAKLRVDKVISTETEANFAPHTAYSYRLDDYKPGVVRVGPRTTYLKEGLTQAEVVKLLGKPRAVSHRSDNNVDVTIYEFQRSDHRVLVAEFEKGVLTRSHTELRDDEIEADR